MLVQHFGIGHAQFAWDLRQNLKIIDIFEKLYSVKKEELLVSFDGSSFHLPHEITNRGYYRGNQWFHTDQKLSDSTFKCVQSWITALDVNEGDATLVVLEKSHLFHEEFSKQFNYIGNTTDWHKLSGEERDFFIKEKGCKRVSIKCPAGSMVFWDSRTIHAGQESLLNREKQNFRMVCYLCYKPRLNCTKSVLKKKQKAFNELRTTSHWPDNPKLFPVNPRTYGNTLPEICEIKPPIVNELGLKLAGF